MAPTVLVTGHRNILLKQNANVAALTRTPSPALSVLVEQSQGRLVLSTGDVSSTQDQRKAVYAAVAAFGRLDALVLNASSLEPIATTCTVPMDDVRKLFEVNFYSCIELVQLASPHFHKNSGSNDGVNARVVFVSSGASVGNTSGWMAYNASKAAINSLARTLANEEPSIVTVAVRPGTVNTDMQALIRAQGASHMTEKDYSKYTDLFKAEKLLAPELPADSIAKLALRAPKKISGSFLDWNSSEVNAAIQE